MYNNLAGKSVSLLISKLTTSIATSQRSRNASDVFMRREEIKYQLIQHGDAAVDPVLELLRRHNDDVCDHAADILAGIEAERAVVPLAKILVEAYPQRTKQAAARALKGMQTPEAALALNLWQTRMDKLKSLLRGFIADSTAPDPLRERLTALADKHRTSAPAVAEAWLLITTTETLSLDAQARLNALRLTPDECAYLEETLAT